MRKKGTGTSYGSPRPWFILMYWTSVLSDPHWKKYSLRSSAIARSSPVLHRLPHDAGQLIRPHLGGRDHQQALLLHRPVDDVVDLVFLVAQLAHAAGRADVLHERHEHVGQRVLVAVLHRLPGQELGDLVVLVAIALVGEAEGGGRGDDHRVSVGREGMIDLVPLGLVLVLEAGDRIRARVR